MEKKKKKKYEYSSTPRGKPIRVLLKARKMFTALHFFSDANNVPSNVVGCVIDEKSKLAAFFLACLQGFLSR